MLFRSLYLVFCYLLYVNWVNNVAFHDLGVKYGQKTKTVQKRVKMTLRAKWSFHTKMEDHVLESLLNFKHERSNSEIFMIL